YYVLFCFFFQAEDGIRDRTVTGVQTCALPICRPAIDRRRARRFGAQLAQLHAGDEPLLHVRGASGGDERCRAALLPLLASSDGRSEERRVGKEWRSRRGGEREGRGGERRVVSG